MKTCLWVCVSLSAIFILAAVVDAFHSLTDKRPNQIALENTKKVKAQRLMSIFQFKATLFLNNNFGSLY